jgi:16S rRNA (cytidine1402-2'-O)-methyltransferase
LLREILTNLGDRRVAVCREMTKLHEEVLRGGAEQVLAELDERDIKGEVAVVVEGEHDPPPPDQAILLAEVQVLVAGGMRTRDAVRAVAERHGVRANELYRAAISES